MHFSQYKGLWFSSLLFGILSSAKYARYPNGSNRGAKGRSFADMAAAFRLERPKGIGEKIHQDQLSRLAGAHRSQGGSLTFADFDDPEKIEAGRRWVDRLRNPCRIFKTGPKLDFRRNVQKGERPSCLADASELPSCGHYPPEN